MQDPLQSLPGVDEHPHQQQPHQQLQLQPPGSACAASVEAAAAGALLRLDVRHGASLKKSMPEAKQYPSWDALNRSSLAVTASCRWGRGRAWLGSWATHLCKGLCKVCSNLSSKCESPEVLT